jgi:hypothetical protein
MKINDLGLLFIICIITANCTNKQRIKNSEDKHFILKNQVAQQMILKSTAIEDSLQESTPMDTTLKGDDRFQFSNYNLKQIAARSDQNFLMVHQKNKTLSICCAWEYFSNVFGSLDKEDLLNKYPFLTYKEERSHLLDSVILINKYFFHDSFLKTYFYPQINSETLVCASITDKEFVLRHNIQIGMDKGSFFKMLFDKNDIEYLVKFDTINIGEDETGGREYYYIFIDQRLNKILIDSDVDWIDKELK